MKKEQMVYRGEDRERLVAEYERQSGSVAEYCREIGVPEPTFRNWLRKKQAGKTLGRAPHGPYTPEERKQAVEAFLKSGMTRQVFAKTWGIGESSLYKWIEIYEKKGAKSLKRSSFVDSPKKRGPKGIAPALRQEIVKAQQENPTYGLRRVKGFLFRFRGVKVSPNTISKTIKQENIRPEPAPRRRRRRRSTEPRRFERSKPNELWQSDITDFDLTKSQAVASLTVFLDDYSRYIVGWKLALRKDASLVIEALVESIERFGRPKEVLTDQGRQYCSWRGKTEFQKLLVQYGIQHVTSRRQHPETLGKCERLWKTIKDELLDRAGPLDFAEAKERLTHFFNHYNHFRPNQALGDMTPADRFFGLESEVRKAIETTMSENEIRLATGGKPKSPTFLIGQVDGQAFSMQGDNAKLLFQLPTQRKELTSERDEDGKEGRGEEGKDRPQEEHEAATEVCTAREDALAAGERGPEGESAGSGRHDPGVLDGPNYEGRGSQEAQCASGESMAAVTASDIGYAGGALGAAQDQGERNTDEPEPRPQSASEEDPGAGGDHPPAGSADPSSAHDAGMPGRIDTDGELDQGGSEWEDEGTGEHS